MSTGPAAIDDLARRWAELAGTDGASERLGRRLIERWSEPHRQYHDVAHLRAVLDAVDLLAEEADDADDVRYAAWFHDAVYDGRPGDDERASAELAAAVLPELGVDQSRTTEVVRLVLLTADHHPDEGDRNGAVLCDADLSILGADRLTYGAYAAAVRREYAHVPDPAFARARAEILTRLRDSAPLFHTMTGRARWEAAAQTNLDEEIARLTG